MVEDELGRGEGVGNNIDHVLGEGKESDFKPSKEGLQNRRVLDIQIEGNSD